MVDGLHIHIQNRTVKPLAIALSRVRRRLQWEGDGRGEINNVNVKLSRIITMNTPVR
jgi:hypothetical protein